MLDVKYIYEASARTIATSVQWVTLQFYSEYSIFILKLKGGLSDSVSVEYFSRMKDLETREKILSGSMVEFTVLYPTAKKPECF